MLVVDDDPGVRAMAVDIFQSLGFTVYDTYNGSDALRIIAEHPEIRLLFADVRMPGMTGTELAQRVRATRPDLKIVLTSGYVDGSPIAGLPFIHKPYRICDLQAILRDT